MKNKIIAFFLIIMYLIFSIRINVYAVESEIHANIYSKTVFEKDATDVVTFLRENFQYSGNGLPKQVKYHTTFSIKGTSDGRGGTTGSYSIYINTASNQKLQIGENISEEDAKSKYGLPNDANPYSAEWPGNIVVEIAAGMGSSTEGWKYEVNVIKIDTDHDLANIQIDEGLFDNEAIEEQERQEDSIQDTVGALKSIKDFIESFLHNPVGAMVNLLCDVVINLFGDICQTLANFVQTGFVIGNTTVETLKPKPVPVFSYNYLIMNQGYNDYTNVSTEEPAEYNDTTIKIENEGYGFTPDTKIPVAIVDFESLARNKISNLDANFFVEDNDQTHSAFWRAIRNFVVVTVRILIFLASALLLTLLIINAVNLASSTITPIERSKIIEGFEEFAKIIFMLIGTVIIMAIGIYSNQMIFNVVEGSNDTNTAETKELPIRVYVEEAKYSFSTTDTGYTRYMASIDNVDMYEKKAFYSVSYFGMALTNLIIAVIMLARMIMMFGLAIMGPLIVIQFILNKFIEVKIIPISYQKWAIWFIALSMIQTLLAIGYVVMKGV